MISSCNISVSWIYYFLKVLFIWERERERESTSGGSWGMGRGRSGLLAEHRAWCGAGSQDREIMTWAKGRRPTTEPPRCPWKMFIFYFIYLFLKDFIYSWETQSEAQRHRQREKQAPCREPDVGLDPGTPGSCPGLKAALNCWATQAVL